MKIEVLGTGCKKCINTTESIRDAIRDAGRDVGADVDVEHVTDPQALVRHGVMSTPAVVIDGKVVHSGSVPGRDTIEQWLTG